MNVYDCANELAKALRESREFTVLKDEKTKLATVEESATANSEDTFLLDRSNHTGDQSAETVLINGNVLNGVVDADLQTAFMALAARVTALENAVP